MNKRHKQTGFSLIELMISSAIGLIAMAAVISVFANSIQSNTKSLQKIRLNQELLAIMDVMVRDIRRSGYWSASDGTNATINPFSTLTTNGANNCLTYNYDVDDDGVVHDNDNQGFKLVVNTIALRKSSAVCTDTGGANWESISDSNTVKITKLEFLVSSDACLNLTNEANPCSTSGDTVIFMYVVDITIDAEILGDTTINDSVSETVAVRNTVTMVVP